MNKTRLLITALTVLLIAAIAAGLIVYVPRQGKTRVTIDVVPVNSLITIDGRNVKGSVQYIQPGEHTFTAHITGFSDDTRKVNIGTSETTVYLLPAPFTTDAQNWIKNNPDFQSQREGIAGQIANQRGEALRAANPLINQLPYVPDDMLFSLDYTTTRDDPPTIYYTISNSSPDGRKEALSWLRSVNVDPATIDLRYSDFNNPLIK